MGEVIIPKLVELEVGKRFILETDGFELFCDRRAGELRLVRRPPVGRESERIIPLESVAGIRLPWTEKPSKSLGTMKRAFKIATRSKSVDECEQAGNELPNAKNLVLWLDEVTPTGSQSTRIPIPIEEIETVEQLIELGLNLAAVADLPYVGLFQIQELDPEFRASRKRERGFEDLPTDAIEKGGEPLSRKIDEMLEDPAIPPFRPEALSADVEVTEWQVGDRVVFRRGLSPLALMLSPFSLLVLAGPALAWVRVSSGRPLGLFTVGFTTIMGVAFGGGAIYKVLRLLPRSVVFDWNQRTLTLTSLFRRSVIPFHDIDSLELTRISTSTSHDGGTSSVSFRGELHVVELKSGKRYRILDIEPSGDRETPLRQALPLMEDLEEALDVESRIRNESG